MSDAREIISTVGLEWRLDRDYSNDEIADDILAALTSAGYTITKRAPEPIDDSPLNRALERARMP